MRSLADLCAAIFLLFVAFFLFRDIVIYDGENESPIINYKIQEANSWVNKNIGTVRIIAVDLEGPKYQCFVLVEGYVNEERKRLDAYPFVPIPGELWEIYQEEGDLKLR